MTEHLVPRKPKPRDLIARIVDLLVAHRASVLMPLSAWYKREARANELRIRS